MWIMGIHLVATITWIGGLLFLWLVLRPVVSKLPVQSQGKETLHRVEERFRTIRWISLIILVVTGFFNILREGGAARLETNWGGVLLIKLLFVAIVVGLTWVNDYLIVPNTVGESANPSSEQMSHLLNRVILILSLVIVFVGVYLVEV
jgi:putative copper export protein